jgi:hypothetical protein
VGKPAGQAADHRGAPWIAQCRLIGSSGSVLGGRDGAFRQVNKAPRRVAIGDPGCRFRRRRRARCTATSARVQRPRPLCTAACPCCTAPDASCSPPLAAKFFAFGSRIVRSAPGSRTHIAGGEELVTHIRATDGGVASACADVDGRLRSSSWPAAGLATPGRPAPRRRRARNGPPHTAARVATTFMNTASGGAPSW